MNEFIFIPENNYFVRRALSEQHKQAEEEWDKALPFIKRAANIKKKMIAKLVAYFYSLVPSSDDYQAHRDFLNKKYKLDWPGKKKKEKRLLEIFINAETLLDRGDYDGFYDEGMGQTHGLFTCIRTGNDSGNRRSKEKVISICKMLAEINILFKKVGKFEYYSDPNNAYVEVSFRLKNK